MDEPPIAKRVAGVDEAGRGPLAGPVVAAAVILDSRQPIDGLADSKKLTARRRAELEAAIKRRALAWAVAEASHAEIDAINILEASLLAMARAVTALYQRPGLVLVDGNRLPRLDGYALRALVGGDGLEPCIAAASILAKEHRDRCMLVLDREYPEYEFARHKGYPTRLHRQRLAEHGVSPVHRVSFRPVRELMTR